MNSIHVLLIENSDSLKASLEKSLHSIENEKFKVETVTVKQAEESFHHAKRANDAVLFGEKLPLATVVRLAKTYHLQGNAGHLIVLTKQSEPRVSPELKKAGIDDILNVMEINTPVFGWTFISALQLVGIKKKAKEYEVIQQRLLLVNNALEHIATSMGEPLDNLRSAAGKLKGSSGEKSAVLQQEIVENIGMMDRYLKELLEIRSRLGKETKVINKFLAVKTGARE